MVRHGDVTLRGASDESLERPIVSEIRVRQIDETPVFDPPPKPEGVRGSLTHWWTRQKTPNGVRVCRKGSACREGAAEFDLSSSCGAWSLASGNDHISIVRETHYWHQERARSWQAAAAHDPYFYRSGAPILPTFVTVNHPIQFEPF